MSGIILDCSIVFGMAFPAMATEYTHAVETALPRFAKRLVPPIFFAEAANACWRGERSGIWTTADTTDFMRILAEDILAETAMIATDRTETEKLLTLIRAHQLTSYDGTYLLLAERTAYPLATQDKALIRAARAQGCYFEG